jgi:hypothetical protein
MTSDNHNLQLARPVWRISPVTAPICGWRSSDIAGVSRTFPVGLAVSGMFTDSHTNAFILFIFNY